MLELLIAGGGFALYLLTKGTKSSVSAPPPSSAPGTATATKLPKINTVGYIVPKADTLTQQKVSSVQSAVSNIINEIGKGLDRTIPGAGAVALALTTSAAVGQKITGDVYGAAAGFLNAGAGNAGNIGRVIGQEIDRLFGGDGKSGAGITAQISGFLSGMVLVSFGLQRLFTFTPVALFAFAVSVIISDITRLQYGSAGRMADTLKEMREYWKGAVTNANQQLRSLGYTETQIFAVDAVQRVHANAIAITIGYMRQKNYLLRLVWMTKPWGIGQTYSSHEKFGIDRGIFLSNADMATVENLLISEKMGGGLYDTVITSQQRDTVMKAGKFLGNAQAWMDCLAMPYGTFVFTMYDHLKWCFDQGLFQADELVKFPSGFTKFSGTWMNPDLSKSSGSLATGAANNVLSAQYAPLADVYRKTGDPVTLSILLSAGYSIYDVLG